MDTARVLETFTRIGFAARGVLYLLIGYLAMEAGRATGSRGVMQSLGDGGLSQVALGVIGLGLLAYGAWRLMDGIQDLEGAGDGAKGGAVRLAHGLSGATHILLGLVALSLTFGVGVPGGGGGGDGQGAETASAWVLGLPGGEVILRAVGVGFMAGGLAQGWSAYRLDFLKHLESGAAKRDWVKWSGRLGYLARGVVFVMVGVLLWQAAGAANPQQAGGTGEAIASLSGWVQAVVAIGLGLFGVFSIVQAVYRRIRDPHVLERLSAHAAR